jgi:hypothetical protein
MTVAEMGRVDPVCTQIVISFARIRIEETTGNKTVT